MSGTRNPAASSTGGLSRAAALKLRLAERAQAEKETQLTIQTREARGVIRRILPIAPPAVAPPLPTSPRKNSRPSTPADPVKVTPPADPNTFTTFLSFHQLDEHQTLVESAIGVGTNPNYDVTSTVALNVNETLLARISSTPLTIQVYEFASSEVVAATQAALTAAIPILRESSPTPTPSKSDVVAPTLNLASVASGSHSAANTQRTAAAHEEEKEDGRNVPITSNKRPGLLLGEIKVSLASLLTGNNVIEGWYPMTPYTPPAPPADYFVPDPDLGQPECFVPFALHQSQQPTPDPSTLEGKHSSRGSAPSTPEKGAKRSTSTGRDKKEVKPAAPVEPEVAPVVVPAVPLEVFFSIRLSRPLLKPDEFQQSTIFSLNLDRLSSLPSRWLQDLNELDGEKDRARAEAEVQIAAWRKKGSKKAAPPSALKQKANGEEKAGGKKPDEKKREKERAKELELKAIGDRLNSQYRYGISFSIPLGNDQQYQVNETCSRLELPPPSPPTSPVVNVSLESQLDLTAGSPRPSSGSSQTSARKGTSGSKPTGDNTNRSGTGATSGTSTSTLVTKAKSKKLEDERLAKEAADAADLAAQKLAARMAARFVPFQIHREIFLTGAGVNTIRELAQANRAIPITIYRELISIDPTATNTVLQRDEFVGVANLDFRSLLKPGSSSLATDASVYLSPQVIQRFESEARERERAALATIESSREDGAASPALSGKEEKVVERRKSSIGSGSNKKSARGKDKSKEDLSGAAALQPYVPPVDLYAVAHTTLSVQVKLTQPIVPLIIKPVLSLNDIIPLRTVPAPPRPVPDVELSEELTAFVRQLSVEYQTLAEQVAKEESANESGPTSAQQQFEHVTASLLYRLNTSGMYQALRDRLKPVITKLHREGRKREQPVPARSGHITFDRRVTRLYTEMIDRLHVTLNELFHPIAHTKPTTVTFIPTLPDALQLIPDSPYETAVNPAGLATEIRDAVQIDLQAEIGSEGPDASTRLAVLAQEAELQGDYPRAGALHQARCLLEYQPNSNISVSVTAGHWYDFACFQLRLQNFQAGGQALRQSLSIDPSYEKSIIALAALSIENRNDLDTAEILLRTYSQQQFTSLKFEYYLLQSLYAEAVEEPADSAQAWNEAHQLHSTRTNVASFESETAADETPASTIPSLPLNPSTTPDPTITNAVVPIAGMAPPTIITLPTDFKVVPPKSSPQTVSSETVYLKASRYFLGLGLIGLAKTVLDKDTTDTPFKSIQLARLTSMLIPVGPFDESNQTALSFYEQAESHLSHAIEIGLDYGQVIEAFAIRGHLCYQQGRFNDALAAYETYQDWEPSTLDPLLLYRLATFYAQMRVWVRAREVYFQLCACAPSAISWLGVARCSMELPNEHLPTSEQALIQANRFDKSHSEIWARLTICSLQHHRLELAHQALIQTIKLQCQEHELFRQIGELYREKGLIDLSVATFERSLALRDSVQIRLNLAQIYIQQHQLETAEHHLHQADQLAPNDEEVQVAIQEQWTNLQKCLGREVRRQTTPTNLQVEQAF